MARILIVDDDPRARRLLVDLLEYEGHVVIECDNGKDGLKAAEREHPDLVISDSHMPGMTGKEFIAELRTQTQPVRIPFIFHTAADDDHDFREIADAHGVAAILTKPCPADVMVAAITSALDGALPKTPPSISVISERLRVRIPAYLASCYDDVAAIHLALEAGNLLGIQKVGHDLKGTGSAYGFSRIAHIGDRLESAAKTGDRTEIAQQARDLASYLCAIKASSAEIGDQAEAVCNAWPGTRTISDSPPW